MKPARPLGTLVLLLTTLLSPLHAAIESRWQGAVDRFRSELDTLVAATDATTARLPHALVDEIYRAHFPHAQRPDDLKSHSTDQLAALHEATETGVFYTLSPFLMDRLGHLVAELVERLDAGTVNRSSVAQDYLDRFHAHLLRARRFSEATAFEERYGLDAPAWVVDDRLPTEARPTVLRIDSSRTPVTLVRSTVDLAQGPRVVAVIHPHCGFSRRAMLAVEADPTLASLFAGRTLWLVDAYGGMPLEPLLEWNTSTSETKIAISYADHEWPAEISFMQVPVLYFFLDGTLRDKVIGWPGPEQVERVHAAFDAIGVTAAGS
jgi:hypothetical protein